MHFRFLIVLFCLVNKTIGQSEFGSIHNRTRRGVNHDGTSSLAERLADWTENDGVNPEELGDDIQGDMRVMNSPDELKAPRPWPGKQIPYEIVGDFTSSELRLINRVINGFHTSTCLRFVPRTNEEIYVRITSFAFGCRSFVGYHGETYDVNLQPTICFKRKGSVIHELMHVTGITHEHSRYNRDNYVRVLWENILKQSRPNFKAYENDGYTGPYNYDSVMHYSNYAFSKNGQRTVVPTWQGSENGVTGQRDHITWSDLYRINTLYQCPAEYFDIPETTEQVAARDREFKQMYHNKKRNLREKVTITNHLLDTTESLIDPETGNTIKMHRFSSLSPADLYGVADGSFPRNINSGSATANTVHTQYPYYRATSQGTDYSSRPFSSRYYPSNTYRSVYTNSQY